MLSSWSLRRFLLRQPHAHEIRVTRDGDVNLVARSSKWSKTADTLHAMEPDLIELLDAEGRVLRAIKPADENDATESSPEVPQVLTTDPNAALLTHFANLIHRAYEHSTTVAFSKMVELVERIDSRTDSVEARLERTESAYRRTVQQQIEDAYERAEEVAAEAAQNGQSLDLHGLATTFLQGRARAEAEDRPPSNGKGRAQ